MHWLPLSYHSEKVVRYDFVFDYLVTAHLLPTNRVARVVEEPRAGFVSAVVSSFRVRFFSPFFGFLVWWFEQSQ